MRAQVTWMRDKYVRGYPRHEDGGPAYTLELGDALTRSYRTDAHFSAYVTPNRRRLTSEILERGREIRLTVIVFDVDGPGHAATPQWRQEIRTLVVELFDVHPGGYWYETRGGGRIVYTQDEPTILRSQADALEWRRVYAIACSYLDRRFQIKADPACADWQRLYRLPRATRDPKAGPENWPTFGDTRNIGALVIEATEEDVETARALAPRAFGPQRRTVDSAATTAGDGHGLLFHALQARGDVGSKHGSDAYVIRCPNESAHSCGASFDGSTLLYLPAAGEQLGLIFCRHGHCEDALTTAEWLALFTDAELDAARRAAGIPTDDDKAAAYRELIEQAEEEQEQRPRQVAAERFRDRFGHWPRREWSLRDRSAA